MEIKSLLVKFGAATADMEAGFKKADGLIQKHKDQIQKVGRAMTVAGAAIVGSLGLMVKGYVSAGDEVHKMALRTSFSTEALSELKYAAEISGASLGDVEKGVKKMSKTIVDAGDGLTTYVRAFDRIGLSAEELMEMSPEEQFDTISKAIAGVENPTLKAAAAQDIFGRAGTKLLPLFAEGEKGLESLRAKAREMGIVFDQEAANKAAALADAVTTLKGSFKGVTNAIAEQLTPIIQGLAEKMTGMVIRVKDWIKDNPVLAGVLVKVAGAVGILLAIMGPLLIMLPAMSAGFTILWGAITGPVGLVIGAIALVAGAAFAIYKNWEPIKEFFIGLWKSVSGFFVNAFNSIKSKLLQWAINIIGIIEKIPLADKLVGPWKDSLQSMKDELDASVGNVDKAATDIGNATAEMGESFLTAIKGTETFQRVTAAAAGETGLFSKIMAGAGAIFKDYGTKTVKAAVVVAVANKKIADLTKKMVNEVQKAVLSDYEYAKRMLKRKLDDRKTAIGEEEASNAEKNAALLAANASYQAELAILDEDHIAREAEKTAGIKQMWTDFYAAVKAKRDENALAEKELSDQLKQLTMDAFAYSLEKLDEEYAAKKEEIENTVKDKESMYAQLKALEQIHSVEKNALYDEDLRKQQERIAQEEAAKKASLENTLSDISGILNTVGGLFSQHTANRLEEIDQTETRQIDSINRQYNKQIDALRGIVDAETAKTEELLKLEAEKHDKIEASIISEYDNKVQWINENVTDEKKKAAMLASLEAQHEANLEKARAERESAETTLREDREAAEQSTADALELMEDAKNLALETLAKDLEAKRAKIRKSAAKREKAVALLSAIVNTAAAVVKALPNIPLSIAIGVLGAIQVGIIAAAPLPLKEGGVVMRPTIAEIGEAGPEAVIPLNKLGKFGMQSPVMNLKMSVYNYGDINNVGDLDDIADQLSKRVTRQLQRGRG